MKITALKTRPLVPPKDDLVAVIKETLTEVPERSVVAISSKVVAIHEGRTVKIPEDVDVKTFKDDLAIREAERYIPRDRDTIGLRLHTIKHNILIGSSGIDKSNGDGYCILWPEDPMRSARELREIIQKHTNTTHLGVVITDSHSAPLRNGVTALALGYAGFQPLLDYRETKDIFGELMHAERLNVADSLATAANLALGEGGECTPLAVIENIPHIDFDTHDITDPYMRLSVDPKEDIFSIFIQEAPWRTKDDPGDRT